MSANNTVYNIIDIFISFAYFIVSVIILWSNSVDFGVLFLNASSLFQVWIHTLVKSKEFTNSILNQLPQNEKNKLFVKHTCKSYARIGTVEIVIIACDILLLTLLAIMSLKNDQFIDITLMRVFISITMFLTCLDSILSCFENMYDAHPALPNC